MPRLFDHPYAEFLDHVAKPSRYAGGEHGSVRKDWQSVQCRVCLAFPDIYDIGMSHLGYRILYKILNEDSGVLAERCYTPWTDMVQALRQHGELLRSLESQRPLCDFDVVGFSLQYELTYTNILLMLDLGGIPLRAEHRGDDDPLIIAGGPVATHAEPMAPFLDAIAIGDGEELLREVALQWAADRRAGVPRRERLERLAQLEGLYVPSLYRVEVDPSSKLLVVSEATTPEAPLPVVRRLVEDINDFPFPDDGPVGGPEAIFDRMSIEVTRGCTEGCRFCQAGMIYRPVRERDPDEVISTVERALAKSGQDEVSLAALSTADVSCINPLIKRLVEKTAPERVSLSVASLRAYGLADDLLDDMRKVRTAGLTFAPEAGTQRMRDVINKNVTEEQLLDTAERVFSRGFDKMKLYFMIGLPTEEDEDVVGIAEVGIRTLGVGQRLMRGRAKVTVSVSTHVPKPHTPFQWCAMDSSDSIRRKQGLLRAAIGRGRNLQLRTHDCSTSVLEGILARGDRRLANVIERAYERGAVFDSWEEHLRLDVWEEALDHFDVDRSLFLGTIPVDARVPWDHFDIGLEQGFLLKEYRKALKNRLSPPCGKAKGMFIHHTNLADASTDTRNLVCYDCGIACDMSQMRSDRLDKLHKLSAFTPGARAQLPVLQPETPRPIDANLPAPERYRPLRAGGRPQRFRLRFQKRGPTALLGHLDLMRELPRVVRRAGIKTHYTQGFHPKPDLSFGPALSLGVASLEEYSDIKLIDAPEPEELLARLNCAASGGLTFTGCVALDEHAPRVNTAIDAAEYLIAFSPEELATELARSNTTLEERIASLGSADALVVTRRVKGQDKTLDLRPWLLSIARAADAGEWLSEAQLEADLTCVQARVAISSQGSIRPSELGALLAKGVPFRAVRTGLLADGKSPLQLTASRLEPTPSASERAIAL